MIRSVVYSMLLIGLPGLLFAQHRKYVFTRLSAKDGLASNHVYSILQDQKGFMWLGTANGLQRYDGRKIVMFRPPAGNAQYLPAAPISQVFQDVKHNFWVRMDREVGIFDPVTYHYKKATVVTNREISPRAEYFLWQDSRGKVFLIITKYGVLSYDWASNSFKQDDEQIRIPGKWNVRTLFEDPRTGHYWMTGDSGLAMYNTRHRTLSYYGHNTDRVPLLDQAVFTAPVTNFYIDKQDRAWIVAWNNLQKNERLYCYHTNTNQLTTDTARLNFLPSLYKEVNGFRQQSDGSLWGYGQMLLMEFDSTTHRFNYFRDEHIDDYGIKYDMVYCMYEDREQNTWMGTDEGVYIFNAARQVFHSIVVREEDKHGGWKDMLVTGLMQRNNQDLLATSWGMGTLTFDSTWNLVKNNVLKGAPHKDADYSMQWDLHEDKRNGRIWIACQDGKLLIHDPVKGVSTFYVLPEAESRTIRQIAQDSAGNIWLSTQYGHLIKWDHAAGYGPGFLKGFSVVQNVQTIVYKMLIDSHGFIWLCTHKKGVFKLDGRSGKIISHFDSQQGAGKSLYSDVAGDILQYNDSLYYIGTGALNILNLHTGAIQVLTNYEGLPSMSVRCIEKANDGTVWLSLSDGICRYNPKRKVFTLFTQKDGIIYGNFENNASTRLHNGMIVFGNPHSMVFFQPEIAYSSPPPLDVTITDFKLFNTYLPSDSIMKLQQVDLFHTQNSITIEFAALSFLQRDKIVYYYQLEGVDEDWIRPDKGLFANYTSLPPGHYIFKVMCENADGIESKNITTLNIYIHPPFYRTWWFLSIIVAFIAGIIYYIHRMRVNRLLGMEKVRSRIARDLHDDMGSTLSTINILSEMAKMKVEKDTSKTSEYLNKISDNSSRMMEAMDDIVWSINPMNDSMQRITARMREFATGVLEARDIDFSFRVDDEVQMVKLDMEARRDLFLLFKEAVNNLAKYSQCRKTVIEIFIAGKILVMNIADDGIGFDVQQADSGNGLHNMHKRAQSLKGKLVIDAQRGKGTRIVLEMPLP